MCVTWISRPTHINVEWTDRWTNRENRQTDDREMITVCQPANTSDAKGIDQKAKKTKKQQQNNVG